MKKEVLYEKLIPKDRDLNIIAEKSINDQELISLLIEGINEESARLKYGCLNTLIIVGKINPDSLYQYFDFFVDQLESPHGIIKLAAIKSIGALTSVDKDNRFEKIAEKYFALTFDPDMTPGATIAKETPNIIKSKPHLTPMILEHLLSVTKHTYKSIECKNILIGHIINALDKIHPQLDDKTPVMEFVKNQIENKWTGTSNKAKKYVEKYDKTSVFENGV